MLVCLGKKRSDRPSSIINILRRKKFKRFASACGKGNKSILYTVKVLQAAGAILLKPVLLRHTIQHSSYREAIPYGINGCPVMAIINKCLMKQLTYFFLCTLLPAYAAAQDTQYWTLMPGSRSALMGGAVIGGTRDNTAVFYNPASLGFIDTASVSVNASLYRLDNVRIEDAVGRQKDFKSSHFSNFPLLLSGTFNTRNPRWKIGYGVSTNVDFDFKATARIDGDIPIVDDAESPGPETFIGQSSISSTLRETSGAISVAYQLNEHWAIGVTNLVTVRTADYIRATLARFYLNTPGSPLVNGDIIQNFRYNHFRYVLRAGLQWRGKKADLGFTVATPGIRLFGKGVVAADITANDIKMNGVRTDILANDRQGKLPTEFRAPFNIAAGANFRFRKSVLGITAQYFGAEAPYDILQAAPAAFVRPPDLYPSLGSDAFLRVRGAARQVVNVAAGYEYLLNDTWTLYGSLRTDMSYYDDALASLKGIKPDLSSWDIYHAVLGGVWKRGRSAVSVGLQISAGKDDQKRQEGNLSNPSENNFLQGNTIITKASYNSVGVLLGYSYSFRKL